MNSVKKDTYFMEQAYKQALKAFDQDEVPIGAVLVDKQGVVLARGYNKVEQQYTQLAHAELSVIKKANKKIKEFRLQGATLYVTVQPCMMCLGALYLSRVSRVVYGVESLKFGMSFDKAIESGIYKNLEMKLEYMEYKKAREVLQLFFKKKRSLKHAQKSGVRKN